MKYLFKKKSTAKVGKAMNHKVHDFACKNYPQIPQRHNRRVNLAFRQAFVEDLNALILRESSSIDAGRAHIHVHTYSALRSL